MAYEKLKPLLEIQELDMKMIRLTRIKKQRYAELKQIEALRLDLNSQMKTKGEEIASLETQSKELDVKIEALTEKYKVLEDSQMNIKKIEEFNALLGGFIRGYQGL